MRNINLVILVSFVTKSFTRDCPHHAEVAKIVKGSQTPVVMKNLFLVKTIR